jgi:hypothetical protein
MGTMRRNMQARKRFWLPAVSLPFGEFGKLAENPKAAASHATDFQVPLYNIWKQQEKTAGSSHFGNREVRWFEIAAAI